MKRYVVTQHGVQEAEIERSFVLEVPDYMNKEDVDAIDEDHLETLANEAGIGWNQPDVTDLQADHHDVAGEVEATAKEQLEVVKWSEETK